MAAALIGASALLFSLLFLPLPEPILAAVADGSSTSLLASPVKGAGFAARAPQKLLGLAVQQGSADAFLRARPLPGNISDVERIARRLVALKPLMISQTELPHLPLEPPVAIAGVGMCDSINGFAATILAREFEQAEIVGVFDAESRGGHSFGRVWSNQYSDWLYFDVWTEEVVVFRNAGGRTRYLFRVRPIGPRAGVQLEGETVLARIRDRASAGLVHNRLQPHLGGYLLTRAWNLSTHGDRSPPGAAEAIADLIASNPPAEALIKAPITSTPAPSAYVRARLAHLRGDSAAARAAYAQVVAAEGGGRSIYGRAARIFIARIDRPAGS